MACYEKSNGSIDAFCWSCGGFDPNPFGDNAVPEPQINNNKGNTITLEEVSSLPIAGDPSRNLSKASMEHFGIRCELSTADGFTPTVHYYPYTKGGEIVGYKKRALPKTLTAVGDIKSPVELFGQKQALVAGNKRLFITEGELDAVSLFQALKEQSAGTKWSDIIPSVVSIGYGAQSAVRHLSQHLGFINSYEQVVLCFDNDEAGKLAVEEVAKLLPTVYTVPMDEKDANEMLMKGKSIQLAKSALFGTKKHRPPAVVSVDDLWDRATKFPVMGMSWPWPSLTKLTYGIRRNMIYGVGAGVGIGKTELFHEIQAHLISTHNLPVGGLMFEEDGGRTLKAFAEKMYNKPFTVPNGGYTQQELNDAIASLRGKVWLYDSRLGKDWDEIKSAIRYMVVGEGIKDIFLDHLTALTAQVSSAEGNDLINRIMSDLSNIVNELDCTIYYASHLNPPDAGQPHERGGKVHESQFTGSRGAIKWSHYLMGLERNKDPELPEESRNSSKLVLLKDRENGSVGVVPLFYNRHSRKMMEST